MCRCADNCIQSASFRNGTCAAAVTPDKSGILRSLVWWDCMLERLEQIEARYEELANELSAPELLADQVAYTKAARQHRTLGEVVEKYRTWKTLKAELAGAQELVESADDEEMREMARLEVETLQRKLEALDTELKLLLVPSDPNDEKNVIVEIRAGTGGDEATLFAAEMLRMYSRYAEKQGWRFEVLDVSESGIGGMKEAIVLIEGDKVYSRMKHESGVHRVQRVPQTEASGRIHTSAITVAVLPEAEEVDVKIDPKDLRIDTLREPRYRSSHWPYHSPAGFGDGRQPRRDHPGPYHPRPGGKTKERGCGRLNSFEFPPETVRRFEFRVSS